MRMSLLEPRDTRSSLNHESHHDQQDYDSQARAEIISQIPTLSPFLMHQLTQRLELESKILDHKKHLKVHQESRYDRVVSSPMAETNFMSPTNLISDTREVLSMINSRQVMTSINEH